MSQALPGGGAGSQGRPSPSFAPCIWPFGASLCEGGQRGSAGDQPADLLAGHDAQLETAVAMMVKALQGKPTSLPAPPPLLPAYPESGIVKPQE
jgi:hypothetical protein